MKRAAIYGRVSTTDQEVGLQETELHHFAEQRGWTHDIFTDRGQSGAEVNRPALDDLLQRIRKKKSDVVVVWALDRLARSLWQPLTIAEECKALAALAETRTPTCTERRTLIGECGWKGGDSGSAEEDEAKTQNQEEPTCTGRLSHGRRLHSRPDCW